jgi:hypothetical protein
MRQAALRLIERYRIKTPSPEAPIGQLSDGNVQRVVLARQLGGEVDVLIVANPCFGLDFGSRRSPARSRKSLAAEHMLGLPALVTVSRKSFRRLTTGRKLPDIGAATLAAGRQQPRPDAFPPRLGDRRDSRCRKSGGIAAARRVEQVQALVRCRGVASKPARRVRGIFPLSCEILRGSRRG